ncbi:MAG: PfkB family carbohydrate kinase, partial [Tepidisphaeraceae bacterium]
ALSRALGERPGMVKVNRRELAETLNVAIDSDESLRDAMRSTMSLGARRVIVTSGPGAVLACDGTHWLRISPPTVKIQSAIGSGDAFAAGLAAGILRKQSFKDACVLAAACAVANAITPHAGHVAQDEVDRLSKRIVVERS